MLHDFQWYCPRVHLTDERLSYCGEPAPSVCQLCVSGGVEHNFADHRNLIETDLEAWLGFNARILEGAARIMAPSQDTASRYARRFTLPEIVVAPHPEPRLNGKTPVVSRAGATKEALRIAVVGAIGRVKGFDILVRMAERAARDRRPFFLTVVGFTVDDERLERYGNARVTGAYKQTDLKRKLDEIGPDFVFLPSIWPETYSYVLSEVWEAGYPVVAFDIGAPADRIKTVGGGVVIPFTRDSRVILDALTQAKARVAALTPMRPEPTIVASLDAYYAGAGARAASVPAAPVRPSGVAEREVEPSLPVLHAVSRERAGLPPFQDAEDAPVPVTPSGTPVPPVPVSPR